MPTLRDLFVIVFIIFIPPVRCQYTVFRGTDGCSSDYRFPGTVNDTTSVSSPLDCVRECKNYGGCDSINVCFDASDPVLLKCEKMPDPGEVTCASLQIVPGCSYFKKVKPSCQNGGTYIEGNSSCICVFGFTGEFCERYYWAWDLITEMDDRLCDLPTKGNDTGVTDCSEAYQRTGVSRGVMTMAIQPKTAPNPFTVSCLLDWGGYTYIEKRQVGCPDVDFNRPWDELKYTVGDPDCSYWLGLENIHHLTAQADYLLDFYISAPFDFGGHPLYTNFKIGNEASGYMFSYDTYQTHTDPADDAFATEGVNGPNGQAFATMDRPDSGGCASSLSAAWWYGPACPSVNLHLPLYDGSAAKHATWMDGGSSIDVTSFVVQLYTTW